MLYNFQRKKLCSHLLVGGALFVAAFGMYSCSDKYDLDTEQPSDLNSIYGYLQDQGNFTTALRLIDDLGKTEILSKTGSKTMFVANDEAFAKFFASNSWGVTSYDKLTTTQKTLLLNSSMIDNPYSTSMLSTAEGPTKGEVCRRSSSQTIYDSVLVVNTGSAEAEAILPKNSRFKEINNPSLRPKIVLYTDASNAAPMVHFTYKFISSNKLESSDIDFLYNNDSTTARQNDDVYVNESKVIKANIFCKNGFIHQVDKVITPLDNMAEIIRKDSDTKIFSSIIERFAAPDYTKTLTDAYNTNKGTDIDSVFNKRYFSDRSDGSTRETDKAFDTDKNGATFDASLKYDPGWNGYMPLSGNPRDAMKEDMAVMLVPTDAAFTDWWEKGSGKVIKSYYHTLDSVPNSVFDDLIRVNQLTSLVGSVPSRFTDVLNDANESMDLHTTDVKEVKIGCNGVIYKTSKVFGPTSYSSVLFPAVINEKAFNILETAIECMDYDKYLNSMVSRYIFVLPTNEGDCLTYIDPVSYGTTKTKMWEFHLDASKTKAQRIYADVYDCSFDEVDKVWRKEGTAHQVKNQSVATLTTAIHDRIQDILDNCIITTGYQVGQKYYKNKGNSYVRVDGITSGSHVWGSLQEEYDAPLVVDSVYTMDNGTTLVVNGPVMGTRKTVAMCLADHPEFSEFLGILQNCGALANQDDKDNWTAASSEEGYGNLFNIKTYGDVGAEDKPSSTTATKKATYLLNNYNYTVYAPTNEAMEKAYQLGLPTLDDLAAAEAYDEEHEAEKTDSASLIREAMLDFVKYHIQNNSIFVDGVSTSGNYESDKTELIPSTDVAEAGNYTINEDSTINVSGKQYKVKKWFDKRDGTGSVEYYTGKYSAGQPYKITVSSDGSSMSVKDNIGERHNVVMTEGLYNIMAQEYWISSTGAAGSGGKIMPTNADSYSYFLNNSSSVVIQGIDGPLIYADGNHKDADGNIVPTQFKYTYKPLSDNSAKRRY